MTTAKAIATLREKMDVSQQAFADVLGVTVTSVSRYENGREPSDRVLKKLAALAESKELGYLRDIFAANRRAAIVTRNENLPSAGTQRRVPVQELAVWYGLLKTVMKAIEPTNAAHAQTLEQVCEDLVDFIGNWGPFQHELRAIGELVNEDREIQSNVKTK
ncbi:MAG: helix-turn-helix domain-containing protein [Bryobacteraceae bacterium]